MTTELPPAVPPGRPSDPPSAPPYPHPTNEHGSGIPPPRPPKPPAPATSRQLPNIPPHEIPEIPPRVNRHSPLEDELKSAYMDEELLEREEGNKTSLPGPAMSEAVDVLLDFGDTPSVSTGNQVPADLGGPSVDLLADLFGSTAMNSAAPSLQPQFNQQSSSVPPPMSSVPVAPQPAKNLLDDLDLFGNDITTTVRNTHFYYRETTFYWSRLHY